MKQFLPLVFSYGILLNSSISFGQYYCNIPGSPSTFISCLDSSVSLTPQYLNYPSTTDYDVDTLPNFTPTYTNLYIPLSLQNDRFTGAVDIGFDFCFYGQRYSKCFISSNGHITFDSIYANTSSSFATTQTIPGINNTLPSNAIFVCASAYDIQSGGNISYAVEGTAPNRKFIVRYSNVPLFTNCSINSTATFQCELWETTNLIKIFISNKPLCNSNPNYTFQYATIGLQSQGNFSYEFVANRNASMWSESATAYQFTPSGPLPLVQWSLDSSFQNIFSTQATLNYSLAQFPTTFYVKLTQQCPAMVFTDSIQIKHYIPDIQCSPSPTTCSYIPNGSITVSTSSPNLPILYSTNNSTWTTSNILTNLPFGPNWVYIKDNDGCRTKQRVYVPAQDSLGLEYNLINPDTCGSWSGSFCVSGINGFPPYQYSWPQFPGVTDSCLHNLISGFYTVSVTDAFGCIFTTTLYLGSYNPLTVTSIEQNPHCGDSSGSINITVYPNWVCTYYWGASLGPTEDQFNLPAGSYYVMVEDTIHHCVTFKSITLIDDSIFIWIDTLHHTTCGLSNGSLLLDSIYPSNAQYSLQWMPGNLSGDTVYNLAPGIYTCTVTDNYGCTSAAFDTILPSLPITLLLNASNAQCDSLNNGIIYSWATNYADSLLYSWSTGATSSYVSQLLPNIYTLTVTDSKGCMATQTAVVNYVSPPQITASLTDPSCYGSNDGAIQISIYNTWGATPFKYSLDTVGNNWNADTLYTNLPQGPFHLYISDANSCIRDTLLYLDQPPPLVAVSNADTVTCFNTPDARIEVTASGGTPGYTYTLNNSGSQLNPDFEEVVAGMYTLTVTDSKGCTVTVLQQVIGPDSGLQWVKKVTPVACYAENTGSIGYSFSGGWQPYFVQWNNGFQETTWESSSIQQLSEGAYWMEVTDARGCTLLDPANISKENCCQVFLPNVFSPNADGKNDIFRPIAVRPIQDIHLMIYDRWGAKVFESIDFNQGWNGMHGSSIADAGTYFYMFYYTCNLTSEKIFMKGDVTLVR